MNTIVALSTPIGTGGIAIVRMSGSDSFSIAKKIVRTLKSEEKNIKSISDFEYRKMYLCTIKTKNFSDIGLVVLFKNPDSFTGEDIVEFQLHGGVVLANGVIKECISHGAVLAMPGEFSKRAFLNGKLSLESAESIIDMINAESDAEINAGYKIASGEFYKLIKENQNILTTALAKINVAIDYPGEDLEYETIDQIKKELLVLQKNLKQITNTFEKGKIIKHGIDVAIIGLPNAGKSSLLNALINEDRAIVSSIPGTTRDTIKENFLYNGLKINLIDTAGINETENEIEKIGVKRAIDTALNADAILYVIDSSVPPTSEDIELIKKLKHKKIIVVKNKSDLAVDKTDSFINNLSNILISVKNKINIEKLKETIYNLFSKINSVNNSIIITNERHFEALNNSLKNINEAIEICEDVSLDITGQLLQTAYNFLGEITGEVGSEKIIDTIFSKFCLGK